jgi:phospholipid/cholesterol/gamma-HCH transport system substrate-binding protein
MAAARRPSRRAAIVVVLLLAAIGAVLGVRAARPPGTTVTADFTGTVGLYPGSDVRMLGVRVGKVDHVRPAGTQVVVTMTIDHGYAAAADTGAVVLSPSLVSDRYVQLTHIWSGGPRLLSGAVIPTSRTATPVELDQLNNALVQFADALGPNGANKDGAFSRLLTTSAANLKGNGAEFNETLTRLSELSGTLANSSPNLFATVTQLSSFTTTLAQSDSDVSGLNSQLEQVTALLASDRQSFADAVQQLGSALGLVQTFISQNRSALTTDVAQLSTVTGTLAAEKASLAEALQTAPQALTNLLAAYDPSQGTIDGRGDLNELSIWANSATAATSSAPSSGSAAVSRSPKTRPVSEPTPPLLLPTTGTPVDSAATP